MPGKPFAGIQVTWHTGRLQNSPQDRSRFLSPHYRFGPGTKATSGFPSAG